MAESKSNNSTTNNNNNNKPWLNWPSELPTSRELDQLDNSLYHRANNESFIRSMIVEIRLKALTAARSGFPTTVNSAIILAGGTTLDFELYDTDTEKTPFRQESFFRYLFGINEPDCTGIMDLTTGESILFVPEVTEDSERWNGTRRPLTYYTERYGVSATYLNTDISTQLSSRSINNLYTLHGENLDSGNSTRTPIQFTGFSINNYTINNTALHPLLTELRLFKTDSEIELMRLGNLISSQAHVYMMRHITAGMAEIQLEALFKAWVHFYGGCRHCAYCCIAGSGSNGSVLHYGHAGRPNDRILQKGDTVVLDMGAEYSGYATDITRSYAINGEFTPDQRIVHTAVYEAQSAVIAAIKPGIYWPDMHRLAEKIICQHLLTAGILTGGTIDELMTAQMGSVFMPHGLGHLIGLDVHDVGGYSVGTNRSAEPGLCWLRFGRRLEKGMVVTVEPGVYFNDPTLDKALNNPNQSKYINQSVLHRFRGSGGCRLEDDVLVTIDGCENLTILPTSVEEIEQVIKLSKRK